MKKIPLILAAALCLFLGREAGAAETPPATALDKILAKRELRCGYLVYSPYIRRDLNSGQLSGVFHDIVEAIGHNANIKIIWAEEVGFTEMLTGLDARRYDAYCGGLWPNATRAGAGYFSRPGFYSVITAWAKADNAKLGKDLSELNSDKITISSVDGAMEDLIASADFPKAKRLSLPTVTPFAQNMLNVTTGKADVTFVEPSMMAEFLKSNPGGLRELYGGKPLRIFGNSLVVRRGDNELLHFFDNAMDEIVYSGKMEEILKKYEPIPGAFRRVALPYQTP
ncbi:MAG: ABC transporter substrate-binding protein [Alphaproteobacteria bacterium]